MRPFAPVDRVVVVLRLWIRRGLFAALLVGCAVATATTVTYTYDEHGRLETSWSDNGTNATAVTYTYDDAGNRTGITSAIYDTAAPSTPAGLTASAVSYSQINLSWSGSTDTGGSGLAGYKIFRGGTQIGTTAATSYSDTTVFGGQTYTYTVAAYDNAQKTSALSGSASATTPPAPDTTAPSVPTGLTASSPSSNQVNLSWNASTDTGGSGLAGYRIYRGGTLIGSTAATSFSDTSASGCTPYTYTVAAYDGATTPNVSAQSSGVGVTTPDTVAPSVPTGLSISAPSSTEVIVSWSASSNGGCAGVATGYRVFRGGTLLGTISATSFSDESVVGSTFYSYTVAAYDNLLNVSAQSSAVSITTPDTIPPSVPTGLAVNNVFATQVGLYWNPASDTGGSGLAGYKVYRNGTQIGTSPTASYTDATTVASTSYTYKVAAYDVASNTSTQSASVSVTTPVAYIAVTDANGAVLAAAASRYSWDQACDFTGVPFCTRYLNKVGFGTVWQWTIFLGDPPGCPEGFGATGFQQISNSCVIQALPSVY